MILKRNKRRFEQGRNKKIKVILPRNAPSMTRFIEALLFKVMFTVNNNIKSIAKFKSAIKST